MGDGNARGRVAASGVNRIQVDGWGLGRRDFASPVDGISRLELSCLEIAGEVGIGERASPGSIEVALRR